MTDKKEELEAARRAKAKALDLFGERYALSSVGITRSGGRYAVKVNLEREPDEPLPETIDGVKVVVKVVGEIRKQTD